MSQHYFYNGTQIDDFDGSKGVIVHMVRHDSSPEIALTEVDIARGGGKSRRDLQTRAKQITIEGTIVGASTQAEFEQRVDTLKALFLRPGELKITPYGTLDHRIATFEEGENWTGPVSYNFALSKIGTRSMGLSPTTGTGAQTARLLNTYDLSAFAATDTVKLWAYIPDTTKVSSIELCFYRLVATDYFSKTWTMSGLSNGWNELTVLRSAFAQTGTGSWSSITGIDLIVTATGVLQGTVDFDDLRFSTDADSRTYEVAPSGQLQVPREHYNSTWVPFTASFSCSSGRAQSSIAPPSTTAPVTVAQQFLPRYFQGSGKQDMQLRLSTGSATPARVVVADHLADTFQSYANIAAAQNVYNTASGTWSLAAHQAYPTCLTESSGVGNVAAIVRNSSIKDGELTALLYRPSGSSLGIVARSGIETYPDASFGQFIQADFGVTPSIKDSGVLNNSRAGAFFDRWWWVKLVCKGSVVQLYYKWIGSDTWTLFIQGSTSVTGAGAWGIYGVNSAVRCAYLELIDYDTENKNALTFRTTSYTGAGVTLDTRSLAADAVGSSVRVDGSFPVLQPGFNRLSTFMPSSSIGSSLFYDMPSQMTSFQNFGGAGAGGSASARLAIAFGSGANTYIRQRGTFVYLSRSVDNSLESGDVVISLQTTSGGMPTGTILTDSLGNPAQVTISKNDLTSFASTLPAVYNNSVVPVEVPWLADIAVAASTTYALVFQASTGTTLFRSWYTPATTVSAGALAIAEAAAGGSFSSSSYYGFAILEGNKPFGDTSSPASVTMAHRASYL